MIPNISLTFFIAFFLITNFCIAQSIKGITPTAAPPILFINKTSFQLLTCMSCVNLNDVELLIIGGKKNDKIPNEKLIYYNVQSKELYELDIDLPESENKNYLFTHNNMFNLFLNGKIISFINIDDYNQVHVIDNELRYDLYLSPNL